MIPSETVRALIEAIEKLDHAAAQITLALEYQAVGSMEYTALLSARRSTNHAAALARSILDRGR